MDAGTFANATVLSFATGIVVYFILRKSQPSMVMKNDKFQVIKAIGYSAGFAMLFSVLVTLISIRVDAQFARKKK